MKKTLFMIADVIISIITFTLANSFYTSNKNTYGTIFYIIGILFISLYSIMLGYNLYKKLNNKNDLLIGGMSFVIYTVSYIIYMTIFNLIPNLNNNIYSLLLIIFYISFLTLIIVLTTIFYYWDINNKRKRILYFIIITIGIIIGLLLSSKLFKNLPIFMVESIKFIYFTGLISLSLYVIVTIISKIVKPSKK